MTELRFTPALGYRMRRACERERIADCISDRRAGTSAYYPHALLSYHYWKDAAVDPQWLHSGFIFGDSGGYSIRTQGAIIAPIDALRWQAQACTVGCVLDVPPADQHGHPCFSDSLARTEAHIGQALPLYERLRRDGSAFRWWGVLHGNFGAEMKAWWRRISAVYPFREDDEGWACRPEPAITPITVAHMLQFIAQHHVRRAHFFATTSVKSVATLAVLAREAGLDFVSFDSAATAIGSSNRQIVVPTDDGLGWTLLREKSQTGGTHTERCQVRDYLWNVCPCVSCAELRTAPSIERVRNGQWVCRLLVHNLLVQVQTFEALATEAGRDGRALLRAVLGSRESCLALAAFTDGAMHSTEAA